MCNLSWTSPEKANSKINSSCVIILNNMNELQYWKKKNTVYFSLESSSGMWTHNMLHMYLLMGSSTSPGINTRWKSLILIVPLPKDTGNMG